MGQDRILGSQVKVAFYGPNGPVNFLETDQFTPNRKSSQKTFQPLGQVGKRTQDVYEGWELSFQGAVCDPSYDYIVDQIDQNAVAGGPNMRFRVVETTTYYDGSTRTYIWPDTVLYDFQKDNKSGADEVTWQFKGSAQFRLEG